MSSEWMKVMLEEIARKNAECAEAEAELDLRRRELEASPERVPTAAETAASETAPGGRPRR